MGEEKALPAEALQAPPAAGAKTSEEEVRIELRDGAAFFGSRHGWLLPEAWFERIRRMYDLAAGLAKPEGFEKKPSMFTRLVVMMEFSLTRRQWNALAKLPKFDRACEMTATMAEAFMEAKLMESCARNPAGAIFALKNSHDWKDQPEEKEENPAMKILAAVVHLPAQRPAPTLPG